MSGNKTEMVTGVITVAIGGFTAAFTPEDIQSWGSAMMGIAPLVLILFLIWRIYKLDQQHKECQESYTVLQKAQSDMQQQVLYAYFAVNKTNTSGQSIADVHKFATNNIELPPAIKDVIKEN